MSHGRELRGGRGLMGDQTSRNFGRLILPLESLAVSCAALWIFLNLWDASRLSVFQVRDLDRAMALAAGNSIFFGPETMGGGTLPGGFYYWLLSMPFRFGFDWTGAWFMMTGLAAASAGVLWAFARSSGWRNSRERSIPGGISPGARSWKPAVWPDITIPSCCSYPSCRRPE